MKHLRLFLLSTAAGCVSVSAVPRHVVLTWQGDTATTMTVNFQTQGYRGESQIRLVDASGAVVRGQSGRAHQIPSLDDRWIHVVELTGLLPATDYRFQAGDDAHGWSEPRRFRTLPDDDRPLRFVTGGDMGVSPEMRQLLKVAASTGPDFAAVGGDIAYANGHLHNVPVWDKWLDYVGEEMISPDGRTIPLIFAIGNHEVVGGWNQDKSKAPFYYGFFAQGTEHAYGLHRLGANLAMIRLDSGHTAAYEGPQSEWLRATLDRLAEVRWKMAIYHVPLYPSHRPYETAGSTEGRRVWAPLFEQGGVTHVFENHDHALKRTHPLKNNQVDDAGIVYFGDGCWGVPPRRVHGDRWYLRTEGSIRHVWMVDVDREAVRCRALDLQGNVLDAWPEEEGVSASGVIGPAPEPASTHRVLSGVLHPVGGVVALPAGAKPGLRLRLAEGEFVELPAHGELPQAWVTRTAITPDLELPAARPSDHFGLQYDALLRVDHPGAYTFFLQSDDGSRLWLDGLEIINNDGRHGAEERSATVTLRPGWHGVRVGYFETTGEEFLNLMWRGPGFDKQRIPAFRWRALPEASGQTWARTLDEDPLDVEEFKGSTSLYMDSSDLEFGGERSGDRIRDEQVGLRFPGCPLPPGAKILAAHLDFTAKSDGDGEAAFTIQAEVPPGAGAFSVEHRVSGRTWGRETVNWTPPPWRAGVSGPDTRSPDLAAVIQAAVDHPAWQSGGDLVFRIQGDGDRNAASAGHGSLPAPRLTLWYAPPAP